MNCGDDSHTFRSPFQARNVTFTTTDLAWVTRMGLNVRFGCGQLVLRIGEVGPAQRGPSILLSPEIGSQFVLSSHRLPGDASQASRDNAQSTSFQPRALIHAGPARRSTTAAPNHRASFSTRLLPLAVSPVIVWSLRA